MNIQNYVKMGESRCAWVDQNEWKFDKNVHPFTNVTSLLSRPMFEWSYLLLVNESREMIHHDHESGDDESGREIGIVCVT